MNKICEHDKREIEKLKEWARFICNDEALPEYRNKFNESYARILFMAAIHSSYMEVERREL